MLHGQSAQSMTRGQEFPASIEAQLLGGDGQNVRANGNLCTPGTNVEFDEKLVTRHCINSSSKTYHGDDWVTFEVEVRGHAVIRHLLDGEVVLEYHNPQLDEGDGDAKRLLAAGAEVALSAGTLSLQAESHPLDFRRVEILVLESE